MVLAMIGVFAGIAVVSLGGATQRTGAREEAQRLASRLNLAVDEALITGTVLVLAWDNKSYHFESWDPNDAEWQNHSADLLGQPHRLSSGLHLEAEQNESHAGQRLPIRPSGTGSPVVMSVIGATSAWQVSFDGLSASTLPSDG